MNSRVRGVVILVLLTALFAIDCAVIPQGNQVEAAFLENNRTQIAPTYYKRFLHGFLASVYVIIISELAYNMKPEDTKEEYKEVQQQLSTNEIREITSCIHIRNVLLSILSPVFVEAFMMTFLAEWGDRSQITTIVLAAREDVIGVIAGGVLGHGLCTGLAVLAGRVVAQRIPVKWLTYIGGVTFLLFGIATFATHPYSR
ncbi:Transmembrane protein [Echinococcus granulosus]|nr:Transmembrane protein [Echinococcus granulosus]